MLSVPRTVSKSDAKKAFFALAKKYHPDANPSPEAADKFKEAAEAYEIISNEDSRSVYDQFGHAGVDAKNGGGGGGGGGGNPFGRGGGNPFGGGGGNAGGFHFHSNGQQVNIEDLFGQFGDLFGQGSASSSSSGPRRGNDLQTKLRVTFLEATLSGTSKDVNVAYSVRDNSTGRIKNEKRSVTVTVPIGVEDGMNLRVAGQGSEGSRGGERGDMFVEVSVEEHAVFERAPGGDIHVEVPVSVCVAALGGVVDVMTIYGEVEMKVPRGTQHGTKLLMKGKGTVNLRGGRSSGKKGDQVVHIKVLVPKKLTTRQEELLAMFEEEGLRASGGSLGKDGKDDKKKQQEAAGIGGRLAQAAADMIFGKKGKKDGDAGKDTASASAASATAANANATKNDADETKTAAGAAKEGK